MDQRTRKLKTMHKALLPRDDVDRLCVSRKGWRKRTCHHWRQRWRIDKTTRRLHRKAQMATDYSHQKRYWHTMDNRMTITKGKWEGKQLYGSFKRLINNISHEKTWTRLRKGNFQRETAQNNAIRTNHIKAKIDKTQQNSKCTLCIDRDETINHIIS